MAQQSENVMAVPGIEALTETIKSLQIDRHDLNERLRAAELECKTAKADLANAKEEIAKVNLEAL